MGDTKRFPELRRRLSPGWWTSNRHYTTYMIREWTGLFVAVYSLITIYGLAIWSTGSVADAHIFLDFLKNPAIIGFSVLALIFTMYHTITTFLLLGAVAPVKIGRTTTKPWQALVLNLVLLAIVSYLAIWLLVLRS